MANAPNLTALLYGKEDLRLEVQPIPQPKEGEVQIAMQKCGLCYTDVHMLSIGLDGGSYLFTEPFALGHESSGIVTQLGPGVANLQVGDRVALELGLPCGKCNLCKCGKYNLCKPWSYGALTRYQVHRADFCHKLPDNVTFEMGALMEPLAVGARAGKRAGITLGSKVLVCGAGPIGLTSLLTAKAMGAAEVCITDLSMNRLQLAKKMGADHTILVDTKDSKLMARRVTDALGEQPKFSIDCTGAQSSLATAIYATASGGVVAPVALSPPEVTLPIVDAATREVDIKGVFSYCNDYPSAIAMVTSGKADPTPMISHRFELEKTLDALSLVRSRADGVVKVMMDCAS